MPTRKDYIKRLRNILPARYRSMSEDRLMELSAKYDPTILEKDAFDVPEPEQPSFVQGFWNPLKEQWIRAPQTAASLINIISSAITPDDYPEARKLAKDRLKFFEYAKTVADEKVQDDPGIQAFKTWAGNNPFSWSKFFTQGAMFGSTVSSVVASAGSVMAAGALGTAVGGPALGLAAAVGTGFTLEGGEAYSEAYTRAKERGWSDEDIEKVTAESGLLYGTIASVLEAAVPFAVLRSWGFGRRAANKANKRLAAYYLNNAVDGRVGEEVMKDGLQQYVGQNLSILRRIMRLGAVQGMESLAEATTEATQYLVEEAIIDNKIDGEEINVEWLERKTSTPEFHQSVAGGLFGGGIFAGPGNLADFRGRQGDKAAEAVWKAYDNMNSKAGPDVANAFLDAMVFDVLNRRSMSFGNKVRFAKTITRLKGEGLPEQAEQPIVPEGEEPLTTQQQRETEGEESLGPKKPTKAKKAKVKTEPPTAPLDRKSLLGATPEEKEVYAWITPGFKRKAIDEYKESTPAAQVNTINMLGRGIESLTKVKLKKDEQGNYDKKDVAREIDRLGKTGFTLEMASKYSKDIVQKEAELEAQAETGAEIAREQADEEAMVEDSKKAVLGEDAVPSNVDKMRREVDSLVKTFAKTGRKVAPAEVAKVVAKWNRLKKTNDPERLGAIRADIQKDISEVFVATKKKPTKLKTTAKTRTTKEQVEAKGKPVIIASEVSRKIPDEDALNLFKFTITRNASLESSENFETLNEMLDEIINAAESGKPIKFRTPKQGDYDSLNDPVLHVNKIIDSYNWDGPSSSLSEMMNKTHIQHYPDDKKRIIRTKLKKVFDIASRRVAPGEEQVQAKQPEAPVDKKSKTKKPPKKDIEGGPNVEVGSGLDEAWQVQSTFPRMAQQPRKAEMIRAALKKQFPDVSVEMVDRIIRSDGSEALGRAIGAAVQWSKFKATLDTLPHEYAHIYLTMFYNDPKVRSAVEAMIQQDDNISDVEREAANLADAIVGKGARANDIVLRYIVRSTPRKIDATIMALKSQKKLISKAGDFQSSVNIAFTIDLLQQGSGRAKKTPAGMPERLYRTKFNMVNEALADTLGRYYADRLTNRSLINRIKNLLRTLYLKLKEKFGKLSREETVELLSASFYVSRAKLKSSASDAYYQVESQLTEDMSDNREGIDYEQILQDNYGGDPGIFMNRVFYNKLGVYLTKEQEAQFNQFIASKKELDISIRENFESLKTEALNKIKELLGFELPRAHGFIFDNWLKLHFQKINSKIEILHDPDLPATNGRIVYNIVKNLRARGKENPWSMVQEGEYNLARPERKNDSFAVMDFVEEDRAKYGLKNTLIRISTKNNLFGTGETREGEPYTRNLRPWEFELDRKTFNDLEKALGDIYYKSDGKRPVMFFLAAPHGDDTQIIISGVNPKLAEMGRKDIIVRLQDQIEKGYINKEHARAMVQSADKVVKSNPQAYTQAWGRHIKMQAVKGYRYLIRASSVAELYKRLKIDLGKGFVPRGSGESSIMILDPKNDKSLRMEAPNENGKMTEVPLVRNEQGDYSFDGWLMTARRYFDRVGRVIGSKDMSAMKSYVRHLNADPSSPGYLMDYIGVKMREMTPFPGTTIYSGDKVIAKYDGEYWRDANGKAFDRVGTLDEVKDLDGRFEFREFDEDGNVTGFNYKVEPLPEDATRIITIEHGSADNGAHPILAHELALIRSVLDGEGYSEEVSELARKHAQNIIKHYKNLADEYLDTLYDFTGNPKSLVDFVDKRLQTGELPQEVNKYIQLFPDGEGLLILHVARQLIPMVNNRIINDGINKGRQFKPGNATRLYLKPRVALNVKDDNVIVSAENSIIRNMVFEKMGWSPEKRSNRWSTDPEGAIADANAWLSKNEVRMLVHRQPIQSFTKVQTRRIQKLELGDHGQAIFLSENDVFHVHEADFDGDFVFLESFDDPSIIDTLTKLQKSDMFSRNDRTIDLRYFKTNIHDTTYANRDDIIDGLHNSVKTANSQGTVVNAKTILSTLAYKEFTYTTDRGEFTVFQPDERVVMEYWPLDMEYVEKNIDRIKAEGDDVVKSRDGKNHFLVTTKQNEFSILLQAAVDESKFGLLGQINIPPKSNMNEWLRRRMFKDTKTGMSISNKEDIRVSAVIYSLFNYSADKRGENENGRMRGLMDNILRSTEIASVYYDTDGNLKKSSADIDESLLSIAIKSEKKAAKNIRSISTNGAITPTEVLLSRIGLRNESYISNLSEEGIFASGPLTFSTDQYARAHVIAVRSLVGYESIGGAVEQIMDKIMKARDVKAGKELDWATAFAQKMASDFYSIEARREAEMTKRGVENPGGVTPKYEFDADYSEFLDKYYRGKTRIKLKTGEVQEMNWIGLTPTQKKISTLYFLSGAKMSNLRGQEVNVANANKLLPIMLMDDQIVQAYGKRYYKALTSNSQVDLGKRRYAVQSIWGKITQIAEKGEYCA